MGRDYFTYFNYFTMAMIILGVLSMFFIWVIVPIIEQSELEEWCGDRGYNDAKYRQIVLTDSYCINQTGNKIKKVMLETCELNNKRDWCFVVMEDLNSKYRENKK